MAGAVGFVINQLLGCYGVIHSEVGIWSDIGGVILVRESTSEMLALGWGVEFEKLEGEERIKKHNELENFWSRIGPNMHPEIIKKV